MVMHPYDGPESSQQQVDLGFPESSRSLATAGAAPGLSHRHGRQDAERDRSPSNAVSGLRKPSLAGLIWTAAGVGLCLDGIAVSLAWRGSQAGQWLFWIALVGPFAVFAGIQLASSPSPALRQLAVVLTGLYPSVMYRMSSPLVLGGFDEHLHERTLRDLLGGGGIFAPNPLLPISPYYPGLEVFTGMLVRLTGIPIIPAMSLVVFLCRILLVLALYHGAAAVTKSYRRASLMVILYAASPQFYFFNSQFAYQTMALTLGVGGLVLLYRSQHTSDRDKSRQLVGAATLALIAMVLTHHATSWMVLGFLIIWSLLSSGGSRWQILRTTLITAISIVAWTSVAAAHLSGYMEPIFGSVWQEKFYLRLGKGGHLFTDASGTSHPIWERAVLVAYAVLCISGAVVCGFILLRRALRFRRPMLGFTALVSLAYPLTLACHLEGSLILGLGDRASTFFFLPVALCCALVIPEPQPVRSNPHFLQTACSMGLIGAATLAYLGGMDFGSGPDWAHLPGRYLVSAESRTQDPETIAAVTWATAHLPPGSRITADRVPADLLAGHARLCPVFQTQQGLDPEKLYTAPSWDKLLTRTVRRLRIRYIYVDTRLSESLPHIGYYVNPLDTGDLKRISLRALTKFAHVRRILPVYHSGPVTIYSTARLGVPKDTAGVGQDRPVGPGVALSLILGAGVCLFLQTWLLPLHRSARELGFAGTSAAVVAIAIFIGSAGFDLRIMPGPAFMAGLPALGAVGISTAWWRRKPMFGTVRVVALRRPLVLLGLLATALGVFLSIHAAWGADVRTVQDILRHASTGRMASGL